MEPSRASTGARPAGSPPVVDEELEEQIRNAWASLLGSEFSGDQRAAGLAGFDHYDRQ